MPRGSIQQGGAGSFGGHTGGSPSGLTNGGIGPNLTLLPGRPPVYPSTSTGLGLTSFASSNYTPNPGSGPSNSFARRDSMDDGILH